MINLKNLPTGEITGIFAVLLAGLVGICLSGSAPIQLFFLFCWIWALIAACLLIKVLHLGGQVLAGAMYLFIATTFLNQSPLSLSVGVFSLFIYRLMLIVSLVILLVQATGRKGLYDIWKQINVKGVLLFLIFWMVYGGVSLLWVQSVTDGIKYLFLLGIGILFIFLAVFSFTKVRQLTVFYGIWLVMTAILIVIGLVNHFAKIQLPTSTLYGGPAYKLGFPTAVFTNQNDFATLLSISFFFYLSCAKNVWGSGYKVVAWMMAALCLYLIFLTQSRAGLLGIAAGLAFFVFLIFPDRAKKFSLVAAALAVLGGAILFSGSIAAKLSGFFSEETGFSVNDVTSSNVVRTHLLQSAVHYIANSYGFGVGAGNLSYYLEFKPVFNTDRIYEVHNWLMEITGNFGLLIGAGYLAMYAALFFSLYRLHRKLIEKERRMLVEAALSGQLAFLISSISPSSVSNLYFHWVFLGFVITLVSVLQEEWRMNETNIGGAKR
ncbi:teichuronic acid biosynthesis protein TuaE [Sporolactobacillus pectinivorans]|uniref:teichuronic acid biosynthesis protein TuaE n=1 Tax=Sporolactobacillus pectinivorans TaxID=1591408 RepID=UPI000C2668B4|nr:O-antigen ligase family protein [Sporolactobacillus pectinivorans]